MKKLLLAIIGLSIISCQTAKVNNQTQQITHQYLELGVIGLQQSQLTNTVFKTMAIPVLEEKIRVQINSAPFSNATYKSYKKAISSQKVKDTISYVDSLIVKPLFINIAMLDQIGYVNELKKPSNASIITYLKNMEHTGVVTSISAAFNTQELTLLQNAEEVYLVNKKHKKYELELYNSNNLVRTIAFTEATVFAYQLSTFCWGKTERHVITIANLSGKNTKCQRDTHKNPQKLIEKVNYFKFSN